MKNLIFLIPAIALLSNFGCQSIERHVEEIAKDANVSIPDAAQALTDSIFDAAQPVLTDALAGLPPETQALAQAAYAALQRGIEEALARGLSGFDDAQNEAATQTLAAMSRAADTLHEAIHDTSVPVPPLAPVLDGNGTTVAPAVPVPDANLTLAPVAPVGDVPLLVPSSPSL